jgi:HEAT repeat protein
MVEMNRPESAHHHEDAQTIERLLGLLCSDDLQERWSARMSLVRIGTPAVPHLIEALKGLHECTRWEAAKVLNDLRDPRAAPALVKTLEDRSFGVRWLAAEGLIGLRGEGLAPLLEALVDRPDSAWLREGAHHVLRSLVGRGLDVHIMPVITAIEDVDPSLELPPAARAALAELAAHIRRSHS